MRHVISINDLADEGIEQIIARGRELRRAVRSGERVTSLEGAVVGTFFRTTSTRTRTAFTSGALRLGARTIAFGPDDLQTNTGETTEDTTHVLSSMLDLLVARTSETEEELRTLAGQDRMGVVNALSEGEHPTQALTDLTTLLCRFGAIKGLRVLYVGEGNSTAAALALALSRFEGVRLELRTPSGYGLPEEVRERVRRQVAASTAEVVERHDMADPPGGQDVIYTTRWQTTGTSKQHADWRDRFAPFRVGSELWESSPEALFMHDLPAHRGDEVTGEVLDGPNSIAFEQAENKMYGAMAVLEWCYSDAASAGTARGAAR